ncbi:glucose 1-dehydrogenase [Halobacterium litoreum]|uniref:Glucose 1-dehydrogenase n=1 Tax=Halobacterium litoreum TaxID=2039234 RepID=A0ABD5NHJ6_9EURY|nr:glucose 1-dehydrogenase [Halobacterium litoreum]UHH12590.1 glucose 1-dehydrogenase [Halobacterium litoreum]
MDAIVVTRDDPTPRVVDRPRPDPGPGEALVRTLRVGVDGTDHEVIAGGHGGFPDGADSMVLGHEAVGVVEDPNDTDLERGQVVVPTVRRPKDGHTDYFERGEPDMAPPGEYVERGIDGADGFMAEYFTSPADCLVPLPDDLAELGFLVEPISITEKAIELAEASRSTFDWRPESALVLGNGSLGLLTLAMLDDYERTYCLGRRDRPDPTIDVIEELGATYVDSRETPVAEIPGVHEPMDFVYEATGYAKHAFDTVHALAPNGVGALLGVPEAGWEFEVAGSDIHRELVLENKALVGSVNSGVDHFEAAIDTLAGLPDWLTDGVVTGVHGLDDFEAAFRDDETTIKTAVQFDSQ